MRWTELRVEAAPMSALGRPERELRPLWGQRSSVAASVGVR